jgi:hypothetical protein
MSCSCSYMGRVWSELVERIGTPLRDQYEAILREPLPERWDELIKRLNEKERVRREAAPPPHRSPRDVH